LELNSGLQVILFNTELDSTVCFKTTQTDWQEKTNIMLYLNQYNGLKKQSLIRTSKSQQFIDNWQKGDYER